MTGLKRIINDMKRIYHIPPNIQKIYMAESVRQNSITMKILSIVIIIIELFNMIRVLFFTNAKLSTVNNQIYFTMYMTLFLSVLVFNFLEWKLKNEINTRMRLHIATAFCWMLWHVVLNCYDLIRNPNGDIASFSSAVLIVAIFAQIKPRYTLAIATMAYFILTIFSGGALDAGGYINATISLILSCLVALRVYSLAITQIYQHLEIADTSEQLRNERAELKSNLEKYEMVLNNTNDHIFEIDFHEDNLVFAKNSRIAKRFGREIVNVTEWLHTQTVMYPEYANLLIEGMQEIITTKHDGDYTFRMYGKSGRDRWFRLRVFVTQNNDDTALKGIGILSDIDVQQRQVETLTSQAKIDSMTGLLNATAFRDDYNMALENLGEHEHLVMFMLDLDNFKLINDTYGHFAGDCVLKEVAKVLNTIFRDYDATARLGGDEFAIIMNRVKNLDIIKAKAEQLVHEISKIEATEDRIRSSCSIGIATTNDKHTPYDEIYQSADKVLYEAKDCGKGCYRINE